MALDRETGQVLSGSFMDYGISRADDLPSFRVEHAEHPTAGNSPHLFAALGSHIENIIRANRKAEWRLPQCNL